MKLKDTLIQLAAIATAASLRYADARGEQNKIDINQWSYILSKLPLMEPSRVETRKYAKVIEGRKMAADLMNTILGINPSEGYALNHFKSFLTQQGKILKEWTTASSQPYSTMTIGLTVEVVKGGKEIRYIPKINLLGAKFTANNSQWAASCDSAEQVKIDIDYQYASHVFNYEALSSPQIAKIFDDFMRKNQGEILENASTFFNDDFEGMD